MPLDPGIVGQTTGPIHHDVDARWVMAYAAGIADGNPLFTDTGASAGVLAHPLFPVSLEWPALLALARLPGRERVTPDERARGVHAAHDLHLLRPIRAGDRLSTTATVVALEQRRPGACQTTRLDTRNADGELVCSTWHLSISRGVTLIGAGRCLEEPPPPPELADAEVSTIRRELCVAREAAHVYTECARIWNPIHTDIAVARAAGLPDIILHGTATLALAVSAIVEACLDGDAARVRRVGGRFSAMVPMPSTLALRVHRRGADGVTFGVLTEDGKEAISRGFVCW